MTSTTGPAAAPARVSPGARDAVFAQLADVGRAEQVSRRIADAIVLGVLVPGERLPSEAELARRFGVALVTAREGLGMLREAGLVATRRGRDGGSFVVAPRGGEDVLLASRLRGLSQVELADLGVYIMTIAAGCADRAAERATSADGERLVAWIDAAPFDTAADARRNAGGFLLELAVLSQSARLVREQIRLQAEYGPLLWIGLQDTALRSRVVGSLRAAAEAVASRERSRAREAVTDLIGAVTEWLLGAKARLERGGELDG
ncbi:FadR family transcriptional regulator [Leifsonia sp. ZF2019]|uniref:FadR/GntR family transcriptional regulator n=1 Tax=Leifsonia sp. ZF2019 TaxID=2781978 RepID=UPI001CBC5796|nr:GntR family transcriptional regulator [Leifsonia sp. ZF2019]UAJ81287.1 FadR family transcriptional regulator [Leifsonia sp. ZF2019]